MGAQTVDELDSVTREFLEGIVRHIYRVSKQSVDVVRDAAQDENPDRLIDRLVQIQESVVDRIFTYIDGQSAPSAWSELGLVDIESGKVLSGSLASDFALVEGAFLLESDASDSADKF